jgi:YVTN family beta-propeller protein
MLDAANFPDVDCAGITNNYCVSSVGQPNAGTPDPSVYILSTGAGSNTTLASGYIHVVTHEEDNEDTVYATGRSNAASMGWLTAINPGAGATPPGQGVDGVVAIELGDMSASNFAVSHSGHKAYVPSSGGGTINDLIRVIDVDHASATHNQIITSVTVGTAVGENRNIQASPDGRVVFVPNTSTNSVSVIDTETDTVVDTMNLATGTTAGNVRAFKLPFDGEDNH